MNSPFFPGALSAHTTEQFTMSAGELKPDFVFGSGSAHELRIGHEGVKFRGQKIEDDALAVYQALRATLGVDGPRGVTFFRNRGTSGIWVEADRAIIDIIENSGSPDVYELRTMYPRPRSPLTKVRMQQLATQAGFMLPDLLSGDSDLLDRLFAFADAVRAEQA